MFWILLSAFGQPCIRHAETITYSYHLTSCLAPTLPPRHATPATSLPLPRCHAGKVVAVDISVGAVNGACAVQYVWRQQQLLPPLRPLTLVVKALLKELSLNEVFCGGISSYCITLMAIAHLQAEGFQVGGAILLEFIENFVVSLGVT